MESLEVRKYYRWNEGPDQGSVELYVCEDDNSVWFESGSSVLKDELQMRLFECSESDYKEYQSKLDMFRVQSIQNNQLTEWELKLGNPEESNIKETIQETFQLKEKSPISIILEKQKKLSKLKLNFDLEELDFPSNKVIEFLSMMFEEDEVVDEITEFVYSQMSTESIHLCIKNSIKNHILSIDVNKDE